MRFAWSMLAEPNLMNAESLSADAFRAGTVPKRDLLVVKVPEAKDYKLVYDLDLAKLGPTITYDVDNRAKIQQPFDRIAYFLELQGADGNTQYLYVSMDAFTDALDKIGVPTVSSGAHFQQNVANMNVYSNAKGIVARTGLAGRQPRGPGDRQPAHGESRLDVCRQCGLLSGQAAAGAGAVQVRFMKRKVLVILSNRLNRLQ